LSAVAEPEILVCGSDFNGGLAERYCDVNRAIADAEFIQVVVFWTNGSPRSTSSRWQTSSTSSIQKHCRRTRALGPEMDAFWRAAARPATPALLAQAFDRGSSSAATSS